MKRKIYILVCFAFVLALIFAATIIGNKYLEIWYFDHEPYSNNHIKVQMHNIITAIDAYKHVVGELPENDSEILAALCGDNERNEKIMNCQKCRDKTRRCIYDPWKTNYKIRRLIEIRSVGKDLTMETEDDIVIFEYIK